MDVAAILHGPDGCSWDRKQTFASLQPYVLEEAHEVIEAVDSNEDDKIVEELGDLLYTIVFYAKIAQKENRFSMDDIIETVREKLIRRHPHVFGDLKIETDEDLEKSWEKIKKEEKGKDRRTHALEGIPASMPLLARAQKILKIFAKTKSAFSQRQEPKTVSEEELGEEFLYLVWLAEKNGIDAESALRRALQKKEQQYIASVS